ncbi:MAG: hypothetical protein SFU27_06765 [Thermonemataceae bacterium]|nr:hypothetical protein [Thermonemataceae bacterium]
MKTNWLILCIFCMSSQILAQNSPFSGFGLGMLAEEGNISQQLNGGIGLSSTNPFTVNVQNPALLTRNTSVIFEAGYQFKSQKLSDNTTSQTFTTGNLNLIALALPVHKKWTTVIGLKPFSEVNYLTETSGKVENSDFFAYYTYNGSGGLNSLFWANGVRLSPQLSVGLKLNYIFGNITQESISELIAAGQNSRIAYYRRNNTKQIVFSPSVAYRHILEKDRKYLNFGLVYDLASNAKTDRIESFEKRDVFQTSVVPTFVDTLLTQEGKTFLPARLQAGFSYEEQSKWLIGADVSLQDWTKFSSLGAEVPELTNRIKISVGTEWTPDYRSGSFWKRSTYRLGFNHTPSILKIADKNVSETNISIGTSLAFSGGQGKLTYVHLGANFGSRGSLSNVGLQEQYITAKLGISLSDVLWFYRPKID